MCHQDKIKTLKMVQWRKNTDHPLPQKNEALLCQTTCLFLQEHEEKHCMLVCECKLKEFKEYLIRHLRRISVLITNNRNYRNRFCSLILLILLSCFNLLFCSSALYFGLCVYLIMFHLLFKEPVAWIIVPSLEKLYYELFLACGLTYIPSVCKLFNCLTDVITT